MSLGKVAVLIGMLATETCIQSGGNLAYKAAAI
jgi:hypothetical protein